jgi:hypothetical protein
LVLRVHRGQMELKVQMEHKVLTELKDPKALWEQA